MTNKSSSKFSVTTPEKYGSTVSSLKRKGSDTSEDYRIPPKIRKDDTDTSEDLSIPPKFRKDDTDTSEDLRIPPKIRKDDTEDDSSSTSYLISKSEVNNTQTTTTTTTAGNYKQSCTDSLFSVSNVMDQPNAETLFCNSHKMIEASLRDIMNQQVFMDEKFVDLNG